MKDAAIKSERRAAFLAVTSFLGIVVGVLLSLFGESVWMTRAGGVLISVSVTLLILLIANRFGNLRFNLISEDRK